MDPPGPTVPVCGAPALSQEVPADSGRMRERGVTTSLHFHYIAHLGACRKTRVVPHNRWPRPEPAEMGVAKCRRHTRHAGAPGREPPDCQRV